mmetsp:Transcript_14861/g.32201  ORF Transcript_14861/g.32201 Transcript_14861/m.32201 type:complete len:343 (+) Transcript_14861:294-1322(+)
MMPAIPRYHRLIALSTNSGLPRPSLRRAVLHPLHGAVVPRRKRAAASGGSACAVPADVVLVDLQPGRCGDLRAYARGGTLLLLLSPGLHPRPVRSHSPRLHTQPRLCPGLGLKHRHLVHQGQFLRKLLRRVLRRRGLRALGDPSWPPLRLLVRRARQAVFRSRGLGRGARGVDLALRYGPLHVDPFASDLVLVPMLHHELDRGTPQEAHKCEAPGSIGPAVPLDAPVHDSAVLGEIVEDNLHLTVVGEAADENLVGLDVLLCYCELDVHHPPVQHVGPGCTDLLSNSNVSEGHKPKPPGGLSLVHNSRIHHSAKLAKIGLDLLPSGLRGKPSEEKLNSHGGC